MDKNTLRSYRVMELEAEQLQELLIRVETRLSEPKTQQLTHTAKGKGTTTDTIGGGVAWLETLRNKYEKRRQSLLKMLNEIEDALNGLESSERLLMRRRYIEGKSWKEIAKELGCSERNATRWHGEILQKMKKRV